MPRLNTKQYLRVHSQLCHFWHYDNRLYSELTSSEQWQLTTGRLSPEIAFVLRFPHSAYGAARSRP